MAVPAALDLESLGTFVNENVDHKEAASDTPTEAGIESGIIAVIPAYNEEVSIGSVVLGALSQAGHAIVVDDYSNDHTAMIAKLAGATVLSMHHHRGKATTLMTGLMEAERSDGSVVVVLDGDGKYLTESIEAVVTPVVNGEADVAIGITYSEQTGIAPAKGPIHARTASGKEPEFWAVSFRALMSLELTPESYGNASDVIDHLIRKGLTGVKLPVMLPKQKSGNKEEVASLKNEGLVGRTVSKVGHKRPLLCIGLPGIVSALGGAALLLMVMFDMSFLGTYAVQMFIGGGLLLIGLFMAITGMMLNLMVLWMKADRK